MAGIGTGHVVLKWLYFFSYLQKGSAWCLFRELRLFLSHGRKRFHLFSEPAHYKEKRCFFCASWAQGMFPPGVDSSHYRILTESLRRTNTVPSTCIVPVHSPFKDIHLSGLQKEGAFCATCSLGFKNSVYTCADFENPPSRVATVIISSLQICIGGFDSSFFDSNCSMTWSSGVSFGVQSCHLGCPAKTRTRTWHGAGTKENC